MKDKMMSSFFILLLIGILYLTIRIVAPYASYLVIAVILAFTTRPLHHWIERRTKKSSLSAVIMILLVLIIILLPSWLVVSNVIKHSSATIASLQGGALDTISDYISELTGQPFNLTDLIDEGLLHVQNYIVTKSLTLISGIAEVVIGLVIMFFVLFYLYRDGHKIYQAIHDIIPLRHSHKDVLFEEIQLVSNAVIYGQLVTALVQGFVAGIGFLIFGIPNALLWGFVTAIISFLPVIGTPLVFIPAGIFELLAGDYVSGIGIIIYGLLLIMNIDDFLKPLIISEKSQLNSALILIGVFGGLRLFGFMGFIIGPIVLAVLLALLKVFRQDFKPSEELSKARRHSNKLVIPLYTRPPDRHRKL